MAISVAVTGVHDRRAAVVSDLYEPGGFGGQGREAEGRGRFSAINDQLGQTDRAQRAVPSIRCVGRFASPAHYWRSTTGQPDIGRAVWLRARDGILVVDGVHLFYDAVGRAARSWRVWSNLG